MDHVRFGENAAAAGHRCRLSGTRGDVTQFRHRDAQTGRLLVQKRTGTGGTGAAHREILDYRCAGGGGTPQLDHFRIGAADLENGLYVRVVAAGTGGLGDDLVHEGYIQAFRQPSGTGAGGGGGREAGRRVPAEYFAQDVTNRGVRLTAGAPVDRFDDVV